MNTSKATATFAAIARNVVMSGHVEFASQRRQLYRTLPPPGGSVAYRPQAEESDSDESVSRTLPGKSLTKQSSRPLPPPLFCCATSLKWFRRGSLRVRWADHSRIFSQRMHHASGPPRATMSSRRSMKPRVGARSSGMRYGLSTSAMTSPRWSRPDWVDSSSNESAGASTLKQAAGDVGQEMRSDRRRLQPTSNHGCRHYWSRRCRRGLRRSATPAQHPAGEKGGWNLRLSMPPAGEGSARGGKR